MLVGVDVYNKETLTLINKDWMKLAYTTELGGRFLASEALRRCVNIDDDSF